MTACVYDGRKDPRGNFAGYPSDGVLYEFAPVRSCATLLSAAQALAIRRADVAVKRHDGSAEVSIFMLQVRR